MLGKFHIRITLKTEQSKATLVAIKIKKVTKRKENTGTGLITLIQEDI